MGERPRGQLTVAGSGAPHEGARLAGVALLLAAACWWLAALSQAGAPLAEALTTAAGSQVDAIAIAGLNLLMVPAVVYLWRWLADERPVAAGSFAIFGLASIVLWAADHDKPDLEVVWIWLSAAWWIGTGVLLRSRWRRLGFLTLVVGALAALDGAVSIRLYTVPFWLFFALGAWKLPAMLIWDIALGVRLIRIR